MNWEQLLTVDRIGKGKQQSAGVGDRSAFEQDYDRIIFSHPFRKLQDKTQVFPLPENDFVHTRLTHSLEVSSVGRSMGRTVGSVICERNSDLAKAEITGFDFGAIVAAAALAHDLGNPPFGHSGEDAIGDFFLHNERGKFFQDKVDSKQWADLCHFEGNAQGFRIMNKTNLQGLKLTNATLAAFSKYPRESVIEKVDKNRRSQKKFGFFQSEKELFQEVAHSVGMIPMGDKDNANWCRHPLAFLVEAADDICYHIIDLEDGCRLGLVSYEEALELFSAILKDKLELPRLEEYAGQNEKVGLLRAMTIGVLIEQCAQCFVDNEAEILSGNFDTALTDLIEAEKPLADIMAISIEKIYRSQTVIETEAAGFEVLPGLLEEFTQAAYFDCVASPEFSKKHQAILRLLPPEIQVSLPKGDIYQTLMVCLDYISSMTDRFALSTYRRIKGISLPGS